MKLEYGQIMSQSEYLRVEEAAREKHEYVAGRAWAMTGASYAHNHLVSNLHMILKLAARPSCNVLVAYMKVKIDVLNAFYYPDLVLICENPENKAVYVSDPRLIVEVLSPSTRSIDLREKAIAYRSLPSLIDYVIVHPDQRKIEVHTKNSEGIWSFSEYADAEPVPIHSLPCGEFSLDINAVYEGLTFDDVI